jgi:hypothetical protein
MSAGWKTLDNQNKTTWTNIKETTGKIQSWGRNRSFIGLSDTKKKKKKKKKKEKEEEKTQTLVQW